MHRYLIFLAGVGAALTLNAPAFAGPDTAPSVAPRSTNSGNGNFGGTEIRHEQQAQASESKQEEANEKAIQLSEVPQAARDAAQKELGTTPTEARIVNGTSPTQYELEAKAANGKEVGVHVLADGKIVKKESK